MKKSILLSVFLLVGTVSYGEDNTAPLPTPVRTGNVTIINHFGSTLFFTINQNNKNTYAPSLPIEFSLAPNEQISSVITPAKDDCDNTIAASTYMVVKAPTLGSADTATPEAYFSVGLKCNTDIAQISGYIGKGLAYSWQNGHQATITFCKPADYPCQ